MPSLNKYATYGGGDFDLSGELFAKTATWRSVSGVNQYGEPSYDEETIRVRWEGKRRLIRDAQGNQVTSETQVFTDTAVPVGDLIVDLQDTEWTVIASSQYDDEGGNPVYYELAL